MVVKERQEGVPNPTRDRQRLMQYRAGKDDGRAGRRLISSGTELGKDQLAALILIGIEVERYRKPAMSRSLGRVVAMRREMAALVGAVAGDNVSLHAGGMELEGFGDFRTD